MEIFLEKENKVISYDVEGSKTLKKVLEELGIVAESVILVKNKSVCLESEVVMDSDKIKILSVVSGG